jgi:hypothetical protein
LRKGSPVAALAAVLLAVAALGCSEKIESGAACPMLCPQPEIQLRDTIVEAVVVDTAMPGFPAIGQEPVLLLTARGDTLDTRPIVRFDTLPQSYRKPGSSTDSTITFVDSATVTFIIDTSAATQFPGKPTTPLTVELYDVDTTAADTVAAGLLPLFRPDRLIGSKTFAPADLIDTLRLPIASDVVLQKITGGKHLRIGLRIASPNAAQLRLGTSASVGSALLRFKPSTDTSITVSLLSRTPTDPAYLTSDLADYVIVAKNTVPAATLLAAGGYPSYRTFLRFDLPAAILDSSTIVRASLLLTQTPNRRSANRTDLITVYPVPITAGPAVTDIERLLTLAQFIGGAALDSIRIAPADTGLRRLELVNLIRVWNTTPPTVSQRAIALRIGAEGSNPAQTLFFPSEAAANLRPRLELSYVPRVSFGLP